MAESREYIVRIKGDTSSIEAAADRVQAKFERLSKTEVKLKINPGKNVDVKPLLKEIENVDPEVHTKMVIDGLEDLRQTEDRLEKIKKIEEDIGSSDAIRKTLLNYSKEFSEAEKKAGETLDDTKVVDILKESLNYIESIGKAADDISIQPFVKGLREASKDYSDLLKGFKPEDLLASKNSTIKRYESLKGNFEPEKIIVDTSDVTDGMNELDNKTNKIIEQLSQPGKVKVFDGISTQIYDVIEDADKLEAKLKEVASSWGQVGFHRGSVIGKYMADTLGNMLKTGDDNMTAGSGTYFTQNLTDLMKWRPDNQHNSFYAADLSKLHGMVNLPSDDYFLDLRELFGSINAFVANDIFPNENFKYRLEGINSAKDIFDTYENFFKDFNISFESFEEFINSQKKFLFDYKRVHPNMSDDELFKSLDNNTFTNFNKTPSTHFIEMLMGAKGINASNLAMEDSTDLGTIVIDFLKQSIPMIDFGDNQDLVQHFNDMIFGEIIKSKALNPTNDLEELIYQYTGRKKKEGLLPQHTKLLDEARQIQAQSKSATYQELNKEHISEIQKETEAQEELAKAREKVADASKQDVPFESHADEINKDAEAYEKYAEAQKLAAIQNEYSRGMGVEIEGGYNPEKQYMRLNELAGEYEQTMREIDDLQHSGSNNEDIQERISLLKLLAEKQIKAFAKTIPNDMTPGKAVMGAFGYNTPKIWNDYLNGVGRHLSSENTEYVNLLKEKMFSIWRELPSGFMDNLGEKIIDPNSLDILSSISVEMERIRDAGGEAHDAYQKELDEEAQELAEKKAREEEYRRQQEEEAARLAAEEERIYAEKIAREEAIKKQQAEKSNKQEFDHYLTTDGMIDSTDAINAYIDEMQEASEVTNQFNQVQQQSGDDSQIDKQIEKQKELAQAKKESIDSKNLDLDKEQSFKKLDALENKVKEVGNVTDELKEKFAEARKSIEDATDSSELSTANKQIRNLGADVKGFVKQRNLEIDYSDRLGELEKLNNKIQESSAASDEFKTKVKGMFDGFQEATASARNLEKLTQGIKEVNKEFKDFNNQSVSNNNKANDRFSKYVNRLNSYDTNKYRSDVREQINTLKTTLQGLSVDGNQKFDLDLNDEDIAKQVANIDAAMDKLRNVVRDTGSVLANGIKVKTLNEDMARFVDKNHRLTDEIIQDIRELREELNVKGLTRSGYTDSSGKYIKGYTDIISEFKDIQARASDEGLVGGVGSLENLGNRIKQMSTNFVAQYFSLYDFARYGKQLASTVTEINSAQTELRKVSDASHARIQENFRTSAETAKELGATITDVISSTSDWARLGYSVDDAEQLARSTTLFQTVGDNMNQQNASEYLTSIMKGYQYDASQSESIIDKVNEVANHYSIDTQGLGEALQRSASAFSTAHTDLDKSIAIITASNEVLQDPEKVGTMWNTVAARLRGASTELTDMGEETDEYVESTSKLRDLVKGYTGFDIMDDKNNFKDLYDIVLGIGQAWGDLEDIQKAALGEALGGKRNARGLYSVFDHLDTLQGAYQTAQTSAGSAAKEQEHYAESVQYSIDRAKASLQELAYDFLSSDTLKSLIDFGNRLLEIVDGIVSRLGTLGSTGLLGGIASVVKGFATNKGIFADLIQWLGNKKGQDVATGRTLSTVLNMLGVGKDAGKKAGEELAEQVAEGAGRKVSSTLVDEFGRPLEYAMKRAGTEAAGEVAGDAIGNAAAKKGAKTFVGKFLGFMKANPALAVGGGIILGTAIAKGAYDKYKKDQIENASTATNDFENTKANVESYKSQYKQLYEQLHSADTSEAQRIEIRKQLLALQQQIVSEYGKEAESINLVTGNLEQQLGILDQITAKKAYDLLEDNATKRAYKDAAKEMTKDRTIDFGTIDADFEEGQLSAEIKKVVDNIDGLELAEDGTGLYNIRFTGNVDEADSALAIFSQHIIELKRQFEDDDIATGFLDGISDSIKTAQSNIDEIYKNYQDNYLSGLEQNFLKQTYGTENNDLLLRYAEARNKMQEAALSEDSMGFSKAQAQASDLYNQLQDISGLDFDTSIKPLVDQIDDGIDKSSELKENLKDLTDDNGVNSTNPFRENRAEIVQLMNDLKKERLDESDFAVLTADMDELGSTSPKIKKLGEALNFSFDDADKYASQMSMLCSILKDLGVIITVVDDNVADVGQSFDTFRASVINDIANIDTLNAALAESFSGKGLTYSIDESGELVGSIAEIKKAYGDLMKADGFDQSQLFEKTANGIHLNQQALRALQSQQEANNKSRFIERENELLEEQANLQMRLASYQDAGLDTPDSKWADNIDGLKSALELNKENLENVRELSAAYDGATSAYQKWVNAQSMGEEGDMYNAIRDTAITRGKELYDQGLVGTNEFRAIAQLYSNEDLSTAPIENIISAYEKGTASVNKFFTEGTDGLDKFAEATSKMGLGVEKVKDESGQLTYVFDNIDTSAIADNLGVSVDMVEAIFRRFADFGVDVQFLDDETLSQLDDLNAKANDAQQALKEMQDTVVDIGNGKTMKLSDIVDFDISSLDTVGKLESKISELTAYKQKFNVDDSEYKSAKELIDQLIAKKKVLEEKSELSTGITLSDIENGTEALSGLEDRLNQIDNYNATADVQVGIDGDEVVMEKVQQIAQTSRDYQISIGIEAENVGNVEGIIHQLETDPHSIKFNEVIGEQITPEDKEGEIDYTEEVTQPLSPEETLKKGVIEFNAKMKNGLKKKDLNQKQSVKTDETIDKTVNEQTNKSTVITAQDNATGVVNTVQARIDGMQGTEVPITADGGKAESEIHKIDGMDIRDKSFIIDANARNAASKIAYINSLSLPSKSVIVTANTFVASKNLQGVINKLNLIKDKTITVKTNYVSSGGGGGGNAVNGSAHASGTTGKAQHTPSYYTPARYNGSVGHSMLNHYRQHAYAGGQWGLEQDEPDALINELGPEIVVRDGSWFVLNNGDPTLANSPKSGLPGGLKKGDIIFNHLQTEEILKHGYVTGSHAKMIGGVAHADGTVTRGGSAFARVNTTWKAGGVTKKKNTTTSSNKKSTTKSTNKSSSSNKKSNNTSTKTNTDNRATQATAEDLDWIEVLLDRTERQLERVKIAADSTFRTFGSRVASVKKEISLTNKELKYQEQGRKRYLKAAASVGLSKAWAQRVRDGKIDIQTIKDDKLKEKIENYKKWYEKALDCKKAIDELNESVKELNKQYFELDQTQYEGILENLEGKISAAEEWVNKREAQGYNIGTGAYTVMISQENTNIDQLVKERTALQSRLNAMVKNGTVARGSEEWNEMNNAIQSVKQSILEAYTQIEEWNKEIRQIGYDRFDAIQEKIADISAEAEFMNTVLKENELYNDNGFRNQYGEATLGLTAISYDAYLNQAEKYRSAVADINKEINKEVTDKTTGKKTKPNLYNQELLDRRKELIEAQRTAIENAYKERDAMKSLVEEGYKKQLEALKKNIDEYTKLLDTQKDAYTYSSDIADKQEEINKLRKQVVSWAGDTSEEGRARRQKVEKELRDAEKALADKQEDRRIAQTKEMLNDLYDSYEKTLNSRLDDVDGLVRDLITEVNVGQSGIISTIKEAAGAVGYSFTDAMNVILNKGGTGLNSNMVGNIQNDKSSSNYGNATNNNRVADATTNTSSTKSIVTKAANQAASEDKTSKTGTTNAINTVTTKKNGWYTEGGKKYYYVNGTPYKNTTQTIAGKKYFFDKNGVMQKGWTYFKKNKKTRYFNSSGAMVTGNQTIGKVKYTFDKNGWLKLNTTAAKNRQATAKKNHAYRRGTSNVPYDEYAWTQEAGGEMILRKSDGAMLTPLGKGDMVFTNQMSENLWNMAKDPLKALAGQVTSHASTSVNNTSVGDITNNFSFNLPNVKDSDEFIRELQHNKKFENIIKSMTLGTLSGKGSLNKFRTHI